MSRHVETIFQVAGEREHYCQDCRDLLADERLDYRPTLAPVPCDGCGAILPDTEQHHDYVAYRADQAQATFDDAEFEQTRWDAA